MLSNVFTFQNNNHSNSVNPNDHDQNVCTCLNIKKSQINNKTEDDRLNTKPIYINNNNKNVFENEENQQQQQNNIMTKSENIKLQTSCSLNSKFDANYSSFVDQLKVMNDDLELKNNNNNNNTSIISSTAASLTDTTTSDNDDTNQFEIDREEHQQQQQPSHLSSILETKKQTQTMASRPRYISFQTTKNINTNSNNNKMSMSLKLPFLSHLSSSNQMNEMSAELSISQMISPSHNNSMYYGSYGGIYKRLMRSVSNSLISPSSMPMSNESLNDQNQPNNENEKNVDNICEYCVTNFFFIS
jgi:hypothetical protein